jgi:hypothetical protein
MFSSDADDLSLSFSPFSVLFQLFLFRTLSVPSCHPFTCQSSFAFSLLLQGKRA